MKTEFVELDKLINIDKSQLIFLGARPGMGKTTLALNIAINIALHQNIPVLFFSLEENYLDSHMGELNYDELMKTSDDLPFNCLADRIISYEEMIDKDFFIKSRKPYLYSEKNVEFDKVKQKINSGIDKIRKSKFYIKDKAPVTIDEIIFDIEKYVNNEGVKFVVIDYFQLIQYDRAKLMSRDNEFVSIIEKIKEMISKLNITILITSQISHVLDYGNNHESILNDLKESVNMIERADTIIFLHRDEYYNFDTKMKFIAELNIVKNNNGSTDTINLIYLNEYFKFINIKNL